MLTVSSLARVTAGQLVTIKGKVVHVSGCKKLTVQSGTLDKQECYVVDPSGNIKIILWGKYANDVQEGKTYQFIKFRLKKYGQDVYLNTPKDDDGCIIEEVDDFQEPLPQVDDVNLSNYKEITVEVLGIQNITKNPCLFLPVDARSTCQPMDYEPTALTETATCPKRQVSAKPSGASSLL